MKITLNEPDGPCRAVIDTDVMDVTLREVFLGVAFETADGCRLAACMRDDGYEVRLDMSALRPTPDDLDRWNEEAAFEAELEADQRWADEQTITDWQEDQKC